MKRFIVGAIIVLVAFGLMAVILRFTRSPSTSPKKSSAGEGQTRTLTVPSIRTVPRSDKWDTSHYVGLLTASYARPYNPYASQTLFRGDLMSAHSA